MKKRNDEKKPDSGRWMLTYSDLITLLMIFFIVMYASSNVSLNKYGKLAQSLGAALGGTSNGIGSGTNVIGNGTGNFVGDITKSVTLTSEQKKLNTVKSQVDDYLKKNGLSASVDTNIDDRGLDIRLNDSILFDSGKADIKSNSEDEIVKIGKILSKMNNYIRVEGHTDNIPISGGQFKSNWQLSSVRAANVAELLVEQSGVPADKISAVGYGENRPIASNATDAGRAKNRRVEIIIINSKFNETEKQ